MKAFIRHIGVIDSMNKVHAVTLQEGVNVITGKSSTGKSALIEIFDYCFGSSDYTIPQGVITRHAVIYFVVMKVKETILILARKPTEELKNKAYYSELFDNAVYDDVNVLSLNLIEDENFQSLADFKKDVGRRFGLIFTDIDEDMEHRARRRFNRRSPTPSIRSFMSFMLQHQNLIANKHAIFYRFDEKEKREQVIDHFKCFMGFAKPEYFTLKQELVEWERNLKVLESQLLREKGKEDDLVDRIELALTNYQATTGTALINIPAAQLVSKPAKSLDEIRRAEVQFNLVSDENSRLRQQLSRDLSDSILRRREESQKLQLVRQSIQQIEAYRTMAEQVPTPNEQVITNSECPFCKNTHSEIELEGNKLEKAIQWLNNELDRSAYLPKSLVEDEQKIKNIIGSINSEIKAIENRIIALDNQDAELAQRRPIYELAVRAKVQVEAVLENVNQDRPSMISEEIAELVKKIEERKEVLNRDHDVDKDMRGASKFINEFMHEWGPKFEFEKSFDPIKLCFSLESFDLWHQNPDGVKPERVYLRSMGSGANWLYSHITLFMALHRYFCHLGNQCLIPPILLLDQPSQVYFPAVLDTTIDFNAEAIATADPSREGRNVDDDIQAVTNLYSRLVEFCEDTKNATGIEPQIIVTDHADKLNIEGPISFESLVGGRRWRTRGLIDLASLVLQ